MIAVTVLLIFLTAVLPDIYTEGEREREEELIFRGNEYARAIAYYHVRFNRYPIKVEDLVKGMNGIKFLRHAYPDPMTRSGKWRFIHANAAGQILDSRTIKNLNPMLQGGAMGAPGGAMGTGFGGAGGASSGFTLGPMGGTSSGFDSTPQGAEAGAIGAGPEGNPSSFGAGQGGMNPGQGPTPSSPTTTSQTGFGFSNETVGLFIVGVASTSHKESFRILNKQKYYDDWEFLGLPTMMTGAMGMPGMSGMPGAMNPTPGGMGSTQPAGAFPPILGNPTTNP